MARLLSTGVGTKRRGITSTKEVIVRVEVDPDGHADYEAAQNGNSCYSFSLTFAHLARCAAAIFRRAAIDRVRLGAALPALPADTGCGPFRTFAHRALCA